ncbi:MAG TPA: M20/M25/M40 family metallo-hydrolase [Dietzia timorensis]|uniref:M20/M25/M40 family metallo-hydrolase n=2 Tax=Dietzia timorensis TaxID=499555 RepID=A0A921JY36_9ACTN|nr:M20/M25/M40 family metallo-hydrolase [Dietzia timorensis]
MISPKDDSTTDSNSASESVDALRPLVAAQMEQAKTDLSALVALPSVHGAEPEACAEAAATVVELLAGLAIPGIGREQIQQIETSDGSTTIVAHRDAEGDKPTVLLYSHYDVQPAGDLQAWTASPWELTEREGRWYGRGAADCKGNFVVHLASLRALAELAGDGADPLDGLGLTLVVEGSEETGGGGLDDLVASRPELFAADAICIVDSGNAAVGVPTLSTSLRGTANVTVTVDTMAAGVHSGQFGGAAPDALAALISMLSSLRDPATGATTIDGVDFTGTWSGMPYDENIFRSDAGILDGVEVSNAAPVADLVWARPTATVLGIDCPPVEGAIGAVQPTARALINLRIPPGMDPSAAQDALVAHLEARAAWNARVTCDKGAVAHPFMTSDGASTGSVEALLGEALASAYGAGEVAEIGSGGSIPLTTVLQEAHPAAQIALYGVEDPAAAIHSPDESVDPTEIERIALAQAAFLRAFSSVGR